MVLNLKEKRTVMNPSIMGDVSRLFLQRTLADSLLSSTCENCDCLCNVNSSGIQVKW